MAPASTRVQIKQAPGEWHSKLKQSLVDFRPLASIPSIFIHQDQGSFFLLMYVDDMVLGSNNRVGLDAFKKTLMKEFLLKDFGLLEQYPGMEI